MYGSSTTFTVEPSCKPSMFFSSAKLSKVTPSNCSEKQVRWQVSSRSISNWCISWTNSMLDTWIANGSTPGLRIWTEKPTSWMISNPSESSPNPFASISSFFSAAGSAGLAADAASSVVECPFISVWPFRRFSFSCGAFDFAFLLLSKMKIKIRIMCFGDLQFCLVVYINNRAG